MQGIFDSGGSAPYHAPAMANPLLDSASPKDLAERGQVIEIKGKVEDFGRLVEVIEADTGETPGGSRTADWRTFPVEIKLAFGWAENQGDIPALSGTVRGRIAAMCQRCLEPFEFEVEAELKVLLIDSADRSPISGNMELWEVEEGTVRPLDIVEEALIMALPLAPTHESVAMCGSLTEALRSDEADVDRPFANLRAQMDQSN